jgi:hypothetical protein
LPIYEEPLGLRQLEIVADALRRYPHHPHGQRRFTDRVFVDLEGYSWHPLSFYWDDSDAVPLWLHPVLLMIVALGSKGVRPLLRSTLFRHGENDLIAFPVNASDDAVRASMDKRGMPQ